MNSNTTDEASGKQTTFLCVIDESDELSQALRFTCRRAVRTGAHIAFLYVIEPVDFQHWTTVGDLMREELREDAEEMLQVVAAVVQARTGITPVLYIREGTLTDELIKLIDEEEDISFLILGAATGADGPGPLVSYMVEKMAGRLRIPITIVPGSLNDEQIEQIT